MIFFFSWCGLFCRKMLVNSKSSMIVCSNNGFFIATRRVHFVSVIVDITNSYRNNILPLRHFCRCANASNVSALGFWVYWADIFLFQ